MSFWATKLLGVRLFLWAELLLAILVASAVILYYLRETLKKKWYALRWPHRLVLLNLVYPAGYVRRFARLIPDEDMKCFTIGNGIYNYNEESVLRKNDWYAWQKDSQLVCRVDDETYNLNARLGIKARWERWPELWYKAGNPWPIDFTKSSPNELHYNANDFKHFKDSKKLNEIYSALTQDNLIIVVIVLCIVIILAVLIVMGKVMGWFK